MKKTKDAGGGGGDVGVEVGMDVVDEGVTLRRKDSSGVLRPGNKSGPVLSSPYSFMRRSCTFVAESSLGLRKSAARTSFTGQPPSAQMGFVRPQPVPQKAAKDRRNLALQVRKKKDMLEESTNGVAEPPEPMVDGVGGGGRMSKLVGGLRAWSSTEDVRQTFMGALGRTVSVIKQKPVSRRVKQAFTKPDSGTPTPTPTPTKPAQPKSTQATKTQAKIKTKTKSASEKQGTDKAEKTGKAQENKKSEAKKFQFGKTPAGKPKPSPTAGKTAQNTTNATKSVHNAKNFGVESTTKQEWFRHIQEAQEAYAARDGRRHRPHATTPLPDPDDQSTPPTDTLQDVDDNVEVEGEAGGEGVGDSSQDASRAQLGTSRTSEQGKADDASGQTSPPSPDTLAKKTAEAVGGSGTPTPSPPAPTPSRSPAQGRRLQEVQIIQIVEGPTLIQPSEVKVSQGLVFSAQPVLTPIEHLRRKDLKIRQALEEKQLLIADILNIPHEHFESVIDMAGEPAVGNKEPKELVLAAMFQAKCLQETLNEVLSINEGDIIAARANSDSRPPPSVTNLPLYQAPMTKLLGISTTLSQQLSSLLNLVSERDDERERMRKELVASRERLHQLHMRQNSTTTSTTQPSSASPPVGAPPPPPASSPHTSRPNSFVSVASSAADHSDTPEHHDTDEDGSGEGGKINMEDADQAKEETAHEISDISVCGADVASGSKSGEVEDTPQAEVGCEEGRGGEEGGGETSTT